MPLDDKRRLGFLIGLFLFASIFIVSGFLHFFFPEPYVRIIPPFLPWLGAFVQISSGAEIMGGWDCFCKDSDGRRPTVWHCCSWLCSPPIHMAVAHVWFSGVMGESGILHGSKGGLVDTARAAGKSCAMAGSVRSLGTPLGGSQISW